MRAASLIPAVLLLAACHGVRQSAVMVPSATDPALRVAAVVDCIDARPAPADLPPPVCEYVPARDDILPANEALGVLWLSSAYESDAVIDSIYGAAAARLPDALAADSDALAASEQPKAAADRPAAIIVDIDETVLDNDGFNARGLARRFGAFDERWFDCWGEERQARAYAGAVALLNDATARGATVFYVTNRRENQRVAVVDTLRRAGFPVHETGANVIFRGFDTTSDDGSREKGARRQCVAAQYRVAMLFGDNLGDFIDGAEGAPAVRAAKAKAEGAADRWGRTWFMLPNPVYGGWLSALQKHRADGSTPSIDRQNNLRSWVDDQLPETPSIDSFESDSESAESHQ